LRARKDRSRNNTLPLHPKFKEGLRGNKTR
jgi:hypothetical protein